MLKTFCSLIVVVLGGHPSKRQVMDALDDALQPCQNYILQNWNSPEFTFQDGTLVKRNCKITTYDMSFCARVCELSPGDICTTSRTNPIGLDVCANGLYCATKKDTSNFGRCERIVQEWNYEDYFEPLET